MMPLPIKSVGIMIRLGFHLSIAGSVANAPKEAADKGYTAFQVFTTSSRSWKNSSIDAKDRAEFRRYVGENDLMPFAHVPYLCNPASPNEIVYNKSKEMLINNINNCDSLGIDYLIIHLGSHLGKGVEKGINNICGALSLALDSTENVSILLENGSGYNNCVGSKFSDIGKIIDNLNSERIGVCFDTCHAFAAGYDLRTPDAVASTMDEFSSNIEMSKLRCVHLNDAKFDLGSGLDRHWHIGKGYIGRNGFVSLFRNRAFTSGSFIMELPDDSVATHHDDMRAITSIIKEASR
jgi:deoxyribonuclease IV